MGENQVRGREGQPPREEIVEQILVVNGMVLLLWGAGAVLLNGYGTYGQNYVVLILKKVRYQQYISTGI